MSIKPSWVIPVLAIFIFTGAGAQQIHFEKIDGAVVTESLAGVERITFPTAHLVIKFNEDTVSTQNLRSISGIYFDMATDAGEIDSGKATLTICPNPANQFIVINNLPDRNTLASIHNLFGDLVQQGIVSAENPQLNIHNLSQGLYLVKVNGQTLKLLKR